MKPLEYEERKEDTDKLWRGTSPIADPTLLSELEREITARILNPKELTRKTIYENTEEAKDTETQEAKLRIELDSTPTAVYKKYPA